MYGFANQSILHLSLSRIYVDYVHGFANQSICTCNLICVLPNIIFKKIINFKCKLNYLKEYLPIVIIFFSRDKMTYRGFTVY